MNDNQFINMWYRKGNGLEAKVIENIKRIKKFKKFQDTEIFWNLVTSCSKCLKREITQKHLRQKQNGITKLFLLFMLHQRYCITVNTSINA